jgi:glycogen synthase kinase 3 beta
MDNRGQPKTHYSQQNQTNKLQKVPPVILNNKKGKDVVQSTNSKATVGQADGLITLQSGSYQTTMTDKKQTYVMNEVPPSDKKTYNAEKIVGNGSFGVVFQATIAETGEVVAIKKVFQDNRYKNRELQILKEIRHPNVTTMRHAFYTQGDNAEEVFLNVVMDYMPETLYKICKYYRKLKQPTPNVLVKLYTYQMFRGLAYIHGMGICHRDIKPQNVLVDPANHSLKICDFGSAKKLQAGEANVSYICSRYYRAPELIFSATDYDSSIDVWSAGCLMAELMLQEPLFPGESGIDQLVEIIKILGTPTIEQVLEMNPTCQDFKFPQIKACPWSKVFKNKPDPIAIDLITKLLVYEPKKRPTAIQVLEHKYFDDLRNQQFKIPGCNLPDLFNFVVEEFSGGPYLREKLIPAWYKAQQKK